MRNIFEMRYCETAAAQYVEDNPDFTVDDVRGVTAGTSNLLYLARAPLWSLLPWPEQRDLAQDAKNVVCFARHAQKNPVPRRA